LLINISSIRLRINKDIEINIKLGGMATKINPRKYSKHGEHRIILSSNRISNLSIGDIKEYKMDSSKRKLNIK